MPNHADKSPGERSEPAPIFNADGALTRAFLLQRGYCCGLGCKNCPYSAEERTAAAAAVAKR